MAAVTEAAIPEDIFVEDTPMTAEEKARLQAMLGNAKKQDTKAIAGIRGGSHTVAAEDVETKQTLVFSNCHDCEYTVDGRCTKLLVFNCSNFKLTMNGAVLTHMCELFRCQNTSLFVNTLIRTYQVDMSSEVSAVFNSKENFQQMIWAGVHGLRLSFLDDPQSLSTSFAEMQASDATLHEERSQFIVRFVQDKLLQEKIIRLPNGFPTTLREKREYDLRQEAALQKLAQEAGITIGKKKAEGPKVNRNDPCPCGSGKKAKKCCHA